MTMLIRQVVGGRDRAGNVPVMVTSGAHEKRMATDQTLPLTPGQLFRKVGKMRLVG